MKLKISTTKNSCNLYVQKSFRDKTGKSTSKIVEKLGSYDEIKSRLNGGDPIVWAKQYIEELNSKENEDRRQIITSLSPEIEMKHNEQKTFNGGYLFLQQIYYQLGLDRICESISKRHGFEYNLNEVLSKMIYSRILFPASKLSTYEQSKQFIEQSKSELHHYYRALDVIAEESDYIQSSLFRYSDKVFGRKTGVIYYDCTNYFFESENAKGIRQYGVSKEHRPNPIVQMGMFMDAEGLPLSMCINPGCTNEQTTLQPLEDILTEKFNVSKFVVCTDGGLSSLENRIYNSNSDRSFITVQSLKKLKAHLLEWALDNKGWMMKGDDELSLYDLDDIDVTKYYKSSFYKERWINEDNFSQRLIVTFSFKYRDYISRLREQQILRAQKKIKTSRTNKKRPNDPARYIHEEYYTDEGEMATIKSVSLDRETINQEAKFDGFYGICTNLKDSVNEIIKINHRRWEIEESFRIMKTDFKSRPTYVHSDQRIKAHFITCFISLIVYRMLEKKLGEKYTTTQIISKLKNMNFVRIAGEGYMPIYTRTQIVDDLHEQAKFRTDFQIITTKKMKSIIKYTKKS